MKFWSVWQVPFCTSWTQSEEVSLKDAFSSQSIPFLQDIMLKYVSHHPSPICFEKHYREYMIASLPHLNVLDNLLIKEIERDFASAIFAQYFEYLPYRRNRKENVVDILQMREIKAIHNRIQTPKKKPSCPPGRSQYFYSRSLGAAKVGSSPWPLLHPLSILGNDSGGERSFRPRQFEYHPSNSSLMVFGTLDGDVVVVNHESEKIVSYIPSLGAMNSVLGLCWLKKHPSKVYTCKLLFCARNSHNNPLQLSPSILLKCLVMPLDYRHAGEVWYKIDDFITSSVDNLGICGLWIVIIKNAGNILLKVTPYYIVIVGNFQLKSWDIYATYAYIPFVTQHW